jgi:phage shock protein PspC (stress-responsive transcriptional regulator)
MFSILVDIFYPSTATVFSKEGAFQQPQAITRVDILGGLRVRLSFRVAVITFVLIVVFTFFPVALVFIIVFIFIWLLSQENVDYEEVRKV